MAPSPYDLAVGGTLNTTTTILQNARRLSRPSVYTVHSESDCRCRGCQLDLGRSHSFHSELVSKVIILIQLF